MTRQDLLDVKDAFVRGAQIARSLGFDGIEIHGAHGYLLDQFLWSETNRRTDEFGGDLAGRARYPCEVVAAIRAAVGPQFPISFRFSQWKERDFDGKIVRNPHELRELLGMLRTAGVDIFHASTRRFWVPEFDTSDLGLAGWTKALTNAAVITVGSVGLDRDIMQSMYGEDAMTTRREGLAELLRRFANREFDLVAAGRAVLGDPDWVRKIRDGNLDALRPFLRKELAFLT